MSDRPGDAYSNMPSLLDEQQAADERREQARRAAPARRRPGAGLARLAPFIGGGLALAGVIAGGAIAWSALRPVNPPDVFDDPFDDVLAFALLEEDFNSLPLEERLALVRQIAERFSSLSAGDSAVMAAFAAGIKGEAREQLMRNTRYLMVDVMDKYALAYAKVEGDREAAIERSMLEMIGLMQDLRRAAGDEPRLTPDETLNRIKERSRAEADENRREADSSLEGDEAAAALEFVRRDINEYSSPGERARVTRFMRDTARYLQGRDVETGQPRKD